MFSQQELETRVGTVKREMSRLGLDALVLFDNERAQGGGNIRYLTNYYTTLPNLPAALVLTPQQMTLCVAQGMYGSSFRVAEATCPWLKVVSSGTHFFLPNLAQDIKTTIDGAGLSVRQIGVDGLRIMTAPLAAGVRAALSEYSLEEDTGIVERVRLVKTPGEIVAIREAARLADIGVTAFYEAMRVGDPQYVSVAAGEQASKANGSDEVSIYMGAGNPWIWGKYRGSQVYRDGDMVAVEFNTRFEGYYGQVARTSVVGQASRRHRSVYETSVQAYQEMKSSLKPGVTAAEIFEAGDRVVRNAGYQGQKLRAGHGMGLTYGEGFDIFSGDDTEIGENYVVMLHAMVPVPEESLVGFSGDNLLVTGSGCEELNRAAFRLQLGD